MTNATPHPNWQSTEAQASSATASSGAKAVRRPSGYVPLRGSPKPAAILGILLTVGLGTALATGQLTLTGQVSSSIDVSIDVDGFDPASVVVHPGETVTWTNDTVLPQTLEILTPDGATALATLTIGTDEVGSVTVPETLAYGVYPFRTIGLSKFTGQITVAELMSSSADASSIDTASTLPSGGSSMSANSAAGIDVSNLPIEANPYALTAADLTRPAAGRSSSSTSVAGTTDETLHGGAPLRQQPGTSYATPPRHAQSGPAAWGVFALSLVAIGYVIRRQTRQLDL
jgi:plastocyanin